ncbi:serine carboxypeptidase S28-domain-containing protein [Crucibulum laeve]|uniref:Serine carboxypeptidase S28-domain-containing protein n=1 Tax=Crucibulum laeve TaxID=68775 RepID=A0A5C3M0J4_9AGAR|nr:serine carboxypeptidase S28-domain-containing protein [Crucibulum laeve]
MLPPRLPCSLSLLLFAGIQLVSAVHFQPSRHVGLQNFKLPGKRIFRRAPPQPPARRDVVDVNGTVLPPYDMVYYFDQLIDHSNPKLGTFKQRYWHTWEYYKPGGPILLHTPGEANAESSYTYVTNTSLQGLIAQNFNGATVVIEHRFFGLSNPLPDLSEKSLELLTIDQGMKDLVYFSQNVKLPMPGGDTEGIKPHKTPWILNGGSYAGGLTTWTMNKNPGVFWAGYSSSGVVKPMVEFWEYFEPIRQNMPQNCSLDVERVVTWVDDIIDGGNSTQLNLAKYLLGLGNITDTKVFLTTLKAPILTWQDLQPTTGPQSDFYYFCDLMEVVEGRTSNDGWGLEIAVQQMRYYFTTVYLPYVYSITCLDFYNSAYIKSTKLDNEDRSWTWMTCNELGWSQGGPPVGNPAIVSRHLTAAQMEDECKTAFPGSFNSDSLNSRVEAAASKYLGYEVTADRLFVANGKRDPWIGVTLSAPSQNIASTALRPIHVSDGFHCSDMHTNIALYDPTIADIHDKALTSMKTWLADFKPQEKPADVPNLTKSNSVRKYVSRGWDAALLSTFVILAVL